MRCKTSGILPKFSRYAVFRCQIVAEIFARSEMANTSSNDVKIASVSDRWCVKYMPPYCRATFASSTISSVEANMSGTYSSAVLMPNAPSFIASRTSPRICSSSSADAGRFHRSQHKVTHAARADKRPQVDRRLGPREVLEILVQCRPIQGHAKFARRVFIRVKVRLLL